jgi:hypothetical protein
MHAALQINGSTVLLNDDFPEYNDGKSSTPIALGGTPVTIHLTVTDVDSKFQQALTRVPPPCSHWRISSGVTGTVCCVTRSAITGHSASRCAR